MDLVTALTLAVATVSLALIINLFINLRQTDQAIEQQIQAESVVITDQPKSSKRKPLEKKKTATRNKEATRVQTCPAPCQLKRPYNSHSQWRLLAQWQIRRHWRCRAICVALDG